MDIDRERQVNAVIKRMKLTRLVLAHRSETLASADRVIVLQAGRTHSATFTRSGGGGVADAMTALYFRHKRGK